MGGLDDLATHVVSIRRPDVDEVAGVRQAVRAKP
jgi:hypothetical protein